jgi:hypothetical protein
MNKIARWFAAGAGIAGATYATYATSTWLRYGRPQKARGDDDDQLLDRFMPTYDVCERHRLSVAAPSDATLAAAKEVELDDSRIIRAIFKARALMLRGAPDPAVRPSGLFEQMKAIGWGVLAEVPDRELVMGAVTKPWEANPVFRPLPPEQFAAFAEPDHVKIAWTLRADPTADGGSVFRTETRAVATDPAGRKKFRTYWSLLSPGIILIRSAMLPQLAAASDRKWRIEGDDIVPDARAQLTHAVAIDAPPKDVWPWLCQMGCQRGGWYSWDRLDNGGVRSAERLIPELQHLEVGDVLPARPAGTEGFKVLRIVPERALVLRGLSPEWEGTWAFALEPLGADRTRLVTRYRAAFPPNARMALMLPLMKAAHFVMERKQLRTIKHHVEAHAPSS